ncbi:hypothetical protein [Sphingomonas sp. Leaf37]|uniref:hypothetical protein n=1 Tax=Sphingomonas sp. Leaf37 TaxID=2876552 RepID=UPI001E3337D6|nr:hypothetical protein [Sphingomonas sp. Leaf37]
MARLVWCSIALANMVVAAVPSATIVSAQTPATGGTVIRLYPKHSVASLGVPEKRDRLPNGETMIYDVSEPTLMLYRPAPGRANGTAVTSHREAGSSRWAIPSAGLMSRRRWQHAALPPLC